MTPRIWGSPVDIVLQSGMQGQLVARVGQAMLEPLPERKSHAQLPAEGSFVEQLSEALSRLEFDEGSLEAAGMRERFRAVYVDRSRALDFDPEFNQFLKKNHDGARAVLAATRSRRFAPAGALRRDHLDLAAERSLETSRAMLVLAGGRAGRAVLGDTPLEPATECVDLIALYGDMARLDGVRGAVRIGDALQASAIPCAMAIARLGEAETEELLAEAESARRNSPKHGQLMEELVAELTTKAYVPLLGAWHARGLPEVHRGVWRARRKQTFLGSALAVSLRRGWGEQELELANFVGQTDLASDELWELWQTRSSEEASPEDLAFDKAAGLTELGQQGLSSWPLLQLDSRLRVAELYRDLYLALLRANDSHRKHGAWLVEPSLRDPRCHGPISIEDQDPNQRLVVASPCRPSGESTAARGKAPPDWFGEVAIPLPEAGAHPGPSARTSSQQPVDTSPAEPAAP